jgi:hypothetical protein
LLPKRHGGYVIRVMFFERFAYKSLEIHAMSTPIAEKNPNAEINRPSPGAVVRRLRNDRSGWNSKRLIAMTGTAAGGAAFGGAIGGPLGIAIGGITGFAIAAGAYRKRAGRR